MQCAYHVIGILCARLCCKCVKCVLFFNYNKPVRFVLF